MPQRMLHLYVFMHAFRSHLKHTYASTALPRAIYNHFYTYFQTSCFLQARAKRGQRVGYASIKYEFIK